MFLCSNLYSNAEEMCFQYMLLKNVGKKISQLCQELVNAYKKRFICENGQVAVVRCSPIWKNLKKDLKHSLSLNLKFILKQKHGNRNTKFPNGLPYDYFCLPTKDTLTDCLCMYCGLYFGSIKSKQNHLSYCQTKESHIVNNTAEQEKYDLKGQQPGVKKNCFV